ncbi:MAG: hypothetical protein M0Z75_01855, partial [Nitrospiraceae bacterium]|nr:hypothetical protein [Nitrospiraceae bacterium]
YHQSSDNLGNRRKRYLLVGIETTDYAYVLYSDFSATLRGPRRWALSICPRKRAWKSRRL